MNVLVTGGTGFIGYHLVRTLLQEHHAVTCLIRKSSNTRWLDSLGDIRYVYGELLQPDTLPAAVEGQDWVFHLAGVVTAVNRAGYIRVNRDGTRNLVKALQARNPSLDKFVYVSSLSAGGPATPDQPRTERMPDAPVTHYGESKLLAEQMLRQHMDTLPITVLRPPVVYGPLDVGVLTFFRLVNNGWQVRFTGEPFYLSLIYVQDLVNALIRLASTPRTAGEHYYIADGPAHSMTHIQEVLAAELKQSPRTIPVPRFLAYVPALFSELYIKVARKPSFLNIQKVKEMTQPGWVCSSHKLEQHLGYAAQYPLGTGVHQTVEWYRAHGWI